MRNKFLVGMFLVLFQTNAHAGIITWITADSAREEAQQARRSSESNENRLNNVEHKLDLIIQKLGIQEESKPTIPLGVSCVKNGVRTSNCD